jgi:hypothetical protein
MSWFGNKPFYKTLLRRVVAGEASLRGDLMLSVSFRFLAHLLV